MGKRNKRNKTFTMHQCRSSSREKRRGIYKEKDRFRRNFSLAKRKRKEREREGYRSLYIERIGACFSLSARPAVSRDNWDTVYYRLRAIVAAVAVCDWIGGDGSREIADPN